MKNWIKKSITTTNAKNAIFLKQPRDNQFQHEPPTILAINYFQH